MAKIRWCLLEYVKTVILNAVNVDIQNMMKRYRCTGCGNGKWCYLQTPEFDNEPLGCPYDFSHVDWKYDGLVNADCGKNEI